MNNLQTTIKERLCRVRSDLFGKSLFVFLCDFNVVGCLQIHPGFFVSAKVKREAHSGINGDASFLIDDGLNSVCRHFEFNGQGVGRHTQWYQIVLFQYFPWVDRSHVVFHSGSLLMIVNDFYVRHAIVPNKANAPLVVNSNAVLPSTVSRKLLQSVARRRPKKVERFSGIKLGKLAFGNCLESAKLFGRAAFKQLLCFLTFEAFNHALNNTTYNVLYQAYYCLTLKYKIIQ